MKREDFIRILGGTVAMATIAPLMALKEPYQFCDEALRLFEAMSYDPDMELKIAIDLRIIELKDSGVWDKLEKLYIDLSGDKDDYPINWINPQSQ